MLDAGLQWSDSIRASVSSTDRRHMDVDRLDCESGMCQQTRSIWRPSLRLKSFSFKSLPFPRSLKSLRFVRNQGTTRYVLALQETSKRETF